MRAVSLLLYMYIQRMAWLYLHSYTESVYMLSSEVEYTVYYRVITIVERDTRKYHEFIAGYCYELSLIHI